MEMYVRTLRQILGLTREEDKPRFKILFSTSNSDVQRITCPFSIMDIKCTSCAQDEMDVQNDQANYSTIYISMW